MSPLSLMTKVFDTHYDYRFLTLVMHYVSRALEFGRARLMVQPVDENALVTIPLLFTSTYVCDIVQVCKVVLIMGPYYT